MLNKLCFGCLILLIGMMLACHKGDKASKSDKTMLQEKTEEAKAVVMENVKDPEKQKQVMKLIDENSKAIMKFHDDRMAAQKKAWKLNFAYDASEADFKKLMSTFNKDYEELLTTLIANRNSMRDLMTDVEWNEVNDHLLKVSK